jgi:hypothetical protein
VFEGEHDVALSDGEIGEEVGGLGGLLEAVASGITDLGLWSGRVDVGNKGTGGIVDVTGAVVNDCSGLDWCSADARWRYGCHKATVRVAVVVGGEERERVGRWWL